MRFRDLNRQYDALKPEIDARISQVLRKGQFIMGEEVCEIEKALAAYVGVSECVTCANGTDALTLSLMAWGIGANDAVFVPNLTFFATAEAVVSAGAVPVFYDVCENTFNADADSLETAIIRTERETAYTPKVVIAVDLFGQCADYAAIRSVTKKYGLELLEDGAQGFGGQIGEKRACSFGDIGTTSFFPAKPLGCYGDGGAIFTNDAAIADKLRSLRTHGASPSDKYDNRMIGMNSRLDTIQAAVLLVKLSAFERYELAGVNEVARKYTERLSKSIKIPFVPNGFMSSWAQYTLTLESRTVRDELKAFLEARGIPSVVYYPRALNTLTAFEGCDIACFGTPVAERITQIVLSLPMHPYLTDEEIDTVCRAVMDYTAG